MDENEKHEKNKKKLKIIGFVLLILGLLFAILGFVFFFVAIDSGVFNYGAFIFGVLGMPMIGFGAMLLIGFVYRKNIYNYNIHETSDVTNRHVEMLKPSLDTIADSFSGNKSSEIICPSCGEKNESDAKFCKKCGVALSKKCPNCGEVVDYDSTFCSHCGHKL